MRFKRFSKTSYKKKRQLIQIFTLQFTNLCVQKANPKLTQISFQLGARSLYEHTMYGTRKEGRRGRGYGGGGEDIDKLL
jgi:hypothetical protein